MCIRHKFETNEGIVPLKEGLFLRKCIQIIGVVLDVAIGRNKESAGAGSRVLNDLTWLRFHQAHDAIDQRARREILPSARFFLGSVFLEQALIEIAESFFASRKPVEFIYG